MAREKLSDEHWKAIREVWEYDPDEPTYNEAAGRSAQKHGFAAPGKSTIDFRAKKEGWERRGSLRGVNTAAQRKADRMTRPDGSPVALDGPLDASSLKKEQAAREESEDKRAEVIARHRQEWQQVAGLRQEAVRARHTRDNPAGSFQDAFDKAKLAKITAEATAIQQAGERKAWGLDIVMDPGQVQDCSDAQLEALARGRVPK